MPFSYQKEQINRPFGEKFFIIKPGAIGDVLHMTPVIRAIKRNSPDSRILFLAGSMAAKEILCHNPYLDEVIIFKKGRGIGEVRRVLKMAKSPKLRGLDWILNYQPSNWRWRLLSLLLKPKGILKYKKQKRIKTGERIRHAVEDHLLTLAILGIRDECLYQDLFLTDQEIGKAMEIIGYFQADTGVKGIVGLNIGASHPVNRWPVSAFYCLDSLLESAGYKTILLGGPEDRILAEEFFSLGPSNILDLVGSLSIRHTAAVISRCDIIVSADTGPLHIATSVGTKVIGLFGAADPARTGPIGPDNVVIQGNLPCVPCRRRSCKLSNRACMLSITPQQVIDKIREKVFIKELI